MRPLVKWQCAATKMSGVEGPSGDGPSGGPGGSPSPGEGSPSGPRVPLKTILQDFLAHVEDLESRRFINPDTDDAYEKEFQVHNYIHVSATYTRVFYTKHKQYFTTRLFYPAIIFRQKA